MLVDMLLGDCLDSVGAGTWFKAEEREAQEATIHAMAKHEGIDPDAVRLQLEMESITLEDVQENQLGTIIAHASWRLNDLTKFIIAERSHLLNALGRAAKENGWQYAPGQVWLRTDETSAAVVAHVAPEQSNDEDAVDLADQINLAQQEDVAVIEPSAAVAVEPPEPETKKPAPRVRKPKSPTKPAAWPWPTSATASPTTAKEAQ